MAAVKAWLRMKYRDLEAARAAPGVKPSAISKSVKAAELAFKTEISHYFDLLKERPPEIRHTPPPGIPLPEYPEGHLDATIDGWDPEKIKDSRQRVLAVVHLRQGQPRFRQALMDAYQRRCSISDWPVEETLEAAHITPYKGRETNDIQNGLLLRSDLHTLFDQGLISVDPEKLTVQIHPRLRRGPYAVFDGKPLRMPLRGWPRPSAKSLESHNRWARQVALW